jgi:hypothetical protein
MTTATAAAVLTPAEVIAIMAAKAPALRVTFLALLARATAVAKARKTLSDDELNAMNGEVGEAHRSCGFGDAHMLCEDHLVGSHHDKVQKDANGRSVFHYMPEADKIKEQTCEAMIALVASPEERAALRQCGTDCYNTVAGRRRHASKLANATGRANDAVAAAAFAVGENVEVHAFGHWYDGVVKSFNKNGRAVVEYTTGTGITREKTMEADKIRKAGVSA